MAEEIQVGPPLEEDGVIREVAVPGINVPDTATATTGVVPVGAVTEVNQLYAELTAVAAVPAPTPTTELPPLRSREEIAAEVEKEVRAPQMPDNPLTVPNLPEKVRVKIKKVSDHVVIESTHPLPDPQSVWPVLLPKHRTLTRRYMKRYSGYDLDYVVRRFQDSITFQEWADYICQATLAHIMNDQYGAEAQANDPRSFGYLAMGDQIFKLSPVAIAPASKALAVARKRYAEQAKEEKKVLIESAKTTADALVQDAKSIRVDAKLYKEKIQQEFGNLPPVSLLESGYYIRRGNKYDCTWFLRFAVELAIKHWDIQWQDYDEHGILQTKTYTWTNEDAPVETVYLAVPINSDGAVGATSIRVDHDMKGCLPHINKGGACMAPQGMPKVLKTSKDVVKMQDAIQFCMRRVQINSLYSHWPDWLPFVQKSVPETIKDMLRKEASQGRGPIIALAKTLNAQTVNEQQEARETWTA